MIKDPTVKDSMFSKVHKVIHVPVKPKLTCEIANVVYCIHCKRCGKMYIGETLRPLRDRLTEHIRDVKGQMKSALDTPVSGHFKRVDHNPAMLRIQVLEW